MNKYHEVSCLVSQQTCQYENIRFKFTKKLELYEISLPSN